MGTKSHWRNNLLRFYGDPMFTAVASQTTNVRLSAAGCDTPTVVVSCPIYAGTFTTQNNMHFRVKAAGVAATSTAHMVAVLRYGSTTILTVKTSTASSTAGKGARHKDLATPYSFDFNGRICNVDSSGRISAVCVAEMGETTPTLKCVGTTGSTAVGVKFTTSNIDLITASTLGLNVTINISSTQAGGAGTASGWTNTIGFVELFSG